LENRRQALRDEVRKIGDFLGAEAELAEEFITLSQKRDLAKTDARQRTELEKLRAQQGRVVRKDDLRQALTHRLLETQEPGDPCPVCGNRHWRAVQQGPEGEGAEFIDLDLAAKISLLEKSLAEEPLVFDQDRWDLLNRKRDEAKSQRVALDRSSSELQGLDHEAAEAQAALKDLELRMADVKSQGKAVAERISDFEEEDWSKLDLDLLEEEETQLRDQQTKLQRAAEEWSQKVQGQKIKTEERRQQLKREEEDYLKTESEIRQELLSGGLELEESLGELFNQRYDSHQARQEVESHQQAWQEVQTRLEGMKVSDHLEQENPRQKLQEVQVQLKEVRNNREIAQEAWAALQAKHQGLKDRLKKQKELLKQREELKEDLSQWELLSQTLAGQRGKKVRFSSFVLQFILQDILHLANQRLEGLSRGQFQFRLLSSNEDGRKKGGLDLMIYDSFCGEERRPQTLSGGEKFLASLALALGLSDGFTLRQGGRNLDALFIDEGFGTLDEEALDRALTVLDEIRSGRIIGLISHVRGLQERIPAVVQIRKTPEGSRIEHRVDRV
jgi:exonuclease SbcC